MRRGPNGPPTAARARTDAASPSGAGSSPPPRTITCRSACAGAMLCLALLTPASPVAAAGVTGLRGPFGQGTSQVWVLAPKSPIRASSCSATAGRRAPPSPGHPWVGQFAPWLEHLLGGGSAVIFPRYQLGLGDPQDRRARAGVPGRDSDRLRPSRPAARARRHGRVLLRGKPRVAYAATYRAWDLPPPRAVMAVFPAGIGRRLPAAAPRSLDPGADPGR